jgi:hypothetical protein
MARWKDDRHVRAIHEASHAVITRMLGHAVQRVTIRKGDPMAISQSAMYLAEREGADVPTLIRASEKDAIVALAGIAGNYYEIPGATIEGLDLAVTPDDDDMDTRNAVSAVYRIACLMAESPIPEGDAKVELDEATQNAMEEIYARLTREAAALVKQHWFAIVRAAKHLERHGRIEDQAALDNLIGMVK